MTRTTDRQTMWHSLAVEDIRSGLSTDLDAGLAESEAKRRLSHHGPNTLPVSAGRSSLRILAHQFKSIIVVLLIAAAAVAFVLRDVAEGIAILVVIVLNAGIGFVIERKAERTLSALREHEVPTAHVVREGVEHEIAAAELVPGDIVVLSAGVHVPADGRVVESVQLEIEESALTGESHTVAKTTEPIAESAVSLGDRINMAYLGTTVTDGRGRLLVTATGNATQIGKIGALVADAGARATPLERRLARLGNGMVAVVLGLGVIIVTAGWLRGHELLRMLEVGVSLAIAAIPEGLLAVSTMTLALGLQRMARRGALIRRLPAVETLGSTTVICTDKTGTLTENQMTVRALIIDGRRIDVTGTGYANDGEFLVDARPIDPNEHLDLALRIGALCNDASLERTNGRVTVIGDPTEAALLVVAEKAGRIPAALAAELPRVAELPFESEKQRMVTVHQPQSGPIVAYMKGSPARVLDLSRQQLDASGCALMLDADRQRHLDMNEALAGAAMRVLGLAYRELPGGYEPADLERDMIFVGLVGMEDPLRETAKTAIAKCREAGIRTMMITGDQVVTATEIARQLAIDRDAQGRTLRAVHGRELHDLDAQAWREVVQTTAVFARVSPEQKLQIVEALQHDAQIVAMTGDGVNDAPALKKADIGIAMGQRGTAVAKQASAMVITDDDFSAIVEAVEQGRIIYANIIKFVHYLFSCNAAEVLTVFMAILIGWPLPLAPLQILWLNIITDVFPALALAVEPSAEGAMQQPPRDPKQRLVTPAMVGLIVWQGMLLAAVTLVAFVVGMRWYGIDEAGHDHTVTMAFMTLALAQVFHAFNARSERRSALHGLFANKWLWAATFVCVLLQLAAVYVPLLQRVLRTTALAAVDWGVVLVCALAPVLIVEIFKLVRRLLGSSQAP